MHGFWRDIRARAWELFDKKYRQRSFWLTYLFGVAAFFLGTSWIPTLEGYRRQWWVIFVFPGFYAVSAFKRAIEDHYDEQRKLAVSRGDELFELERQLRQRQDDAAVAKQRRETVSRLEALQNDGIALSAEMKQTYNPDKHRSMVVRWERAVEACLSDRAPDRLNAFRLPIPASPNRHLGDGERIILEFDQRLGRLQQTIDGIRG